MQKFKTQSIFVSPKIDKRLKQQALENAPNEKNNNTLKLTDRELQIFELIGKGTKTKNIANILKLSIKTIETHRRHIKDKLSLTSGTELVRAAIMWSLESQS